MTLTDGWIGSAAAFDISSFSWLIIKKNNVTSHHSLKRDVQFKTLFNGIKSLEVEYLERLSVLCLGFQMLMMMNIGMVAGSDIESG